MELRGAEAGTCTKDMYEKSGRPDGAGRFRPGDVGSVEGYASSASYEKLS